MFAAASAANLGGLGAYSADANTTIAHGYGTDPSFAKVYKPGDVWPLTLSAPQRRTVAAFSDLLLPADDLGPAASAVGVPEFLDEWISAPYPEQQADRPMLLAGLDWLDTEATMRFGKLFADLDEAQRHAIADDICDPAKAKDEFRRAAEFFVLFRTLAAGGYYCTQEGWKSIGFVGNAPTAVFTGPPPEVLKLLDVEQTVQ